MAAIAVRKQDLIDQNDHVFNPFAEKGWKVIENHRGGQWQFNPREVQLFVSKSQLYGNTVKGWRLLDELEAIQERGEAVLCNSHDLWRFFVNQNRIPKEWKRHGGVQCRIQFWGTKFGKKDEKVSIAHLTWDIEGGGLSIGLSPLDGDFVFFDQAAFRTLVTA